MTVDEQKARIDELDAEIKRLGSERASLARAVAIAAASAKGIQIGSVVNIQWGSSASKQTRRYRITEIAPYWDEFKLYGVCIRKDGSDGEKTHIWQTILNVET